MINDKSKKRVTVVIIYPDFTFNLQNQGIYNFGDKINFNCTN